MVKKMLLLALLFVATSTVMAGEDLPYWQWVGPTSGGEWSDTNAWAYYTSDVEENPVFQYYGTPVAGQKAVIVVQTNIDGSKTGPEVTIAAGTNAVCSNFGLDGSSVWTDLDLNVHHTMSTLNITGGSLTCDNMFIGNDNRNYGSVYQSDGIVTISGNLELPYRTYGYYSLTGGELHVGTTLAMNVKSSDGYLYNDSEYRMDVHGGTAYVNAISFAVQRTRPDGSTFVPVIDFTSDGMMVLTGDQVANVDTWIAAGNMTAYDGAGTVSRWYDSGFTYVTGIPEPISMLLRGLGGLAALRRRK